MPRRTPEKKAVDRRPNEHQRSDAWGTLALQGTRRTDDQCSYVSATSAVGSFNMVWNCSTLILMRDHHDVPTEKDESVVRIS
jgi:hypothetical protein